MPQSTYVEKLSLHIGHFAIKARPEEMSGCTRNAVDAYEAWVSADYVQNVWGRFLHSQLLIAYHIPSSPTLFLGLVV